MLGIDSYRRRRSDEEARILDAVGQTFGVHPQEIVGRDRHARTALARHAFAWCLRQRGYSYPEIGRALGHLDHTSAMHAVAKISSASFTPAREACAAILGNRPAVVVPGLGLQRERRETLRRALVAALDVLDTEDAVVEGTVPS